MRGQVSVGDDANTRLGFQPSAHRWHHLEPWSRLLANWCWCWCWCWRLRTGCLAVEFPIQFSPGTLRHRRLHVLLVVNAEARWWSTGLEVLGQRHWSPRNSRRRRRRLLCCLVFVHLHECFLQGQTGLGFDLTEVSDRRLHRPLRGRELGVDLREAACGRRCKVAPVVVRKGDDGDRLFLLGYGLRLLNGLRLHVGVRTKIAADEIDGVIGALLQQGLHRLTQPLLDEPLAKILHCLALHVRHLRLSVHDSLLLQGGDDLQLRPWRVRLQGLHAHLAGLFFRANGDRTSADMHVQVDLGLATVRWRGELECTLRLVAALLLHVADADAHEAALGEVGAIRGLDPQLHGLEGIDSAQVLSCQWIGWAPREPQA
mmetsp:Transcript_93266/g.278430  ORF Transcript_93266/g.278430 Transcript_93266/m.278430 type:complete len:372 (+) Transcript_93266:930-2045(+)